MFFHATSHRASDKVDRSLGRHPQHYFRTDNQHSGVYFRLDDAAEIEKALAAGARKCRDQRVEKYLLCW